MRFPGDGRSRRGPARLTMKLSVVGKLFHVLILDLSLLEMLNTLTSAGHSIKAFTGEQIKYQLKSVWAGQTLYAPICS